jgi:steroid delta-isomerase-like uncharacterized protein
MLRRKGTSDSSELKNLARRWISLWSVPTDWELFDRLHADDFWDGSPAGRETSKSGFAAGLAEFLAAFRDLQSKVVDIVVDEEAQKIAVRWSATGTNQKRFLGIGPTGKFMSFQGIEILEVDNGRIRRRWRECDGGKEI